jgi:hypothetical protein
MPERNLHYDGLVNSLENIINLTNQRIRLGISIPDNMKGELESANILLKKLKDEAKVFWIDELTLESLLNEPYQITDFSKPEYKLPFPVMFIDFEKSIPYRFLEKRDEDSKERVGGLFLSELKKDFMFNKLNYDKEITPGNFALSAFRDDGDNYFVNLYNVGDSVMIREVCSKDTEIPISRKYIFSIKERKLIRCVEKVTEKEKQEIIRENKDIPDWAFDYQEVDYKMQDDDCLDAFKLANMSINTIDYINARNIVVRERRRFRTEHVREGTGKDRHLVKKEYEMKQYYWIDIKKQYVDADHEDSGRELNCQFWVRGHNRYYQDGSHVWIYPYRKGPVDAPWKYHRWSMKFKHFEPVLRNPTLREG